MNKICLIVCYFGEWPSYFDYFLLSCSQNSQVTWLIFSDNQYSGKNPDNIHFKSFTKKEFNKLATEKLGFEIRITNPYKLCDFRPTFGKIFEDFLIDYDFWGYCDIDLVFGNIGHFINNNSLQNYDIVSFYKGFLSGPFIIYRNNELIKNLYNSSLDHIKILQSNDHFAFDENVTKQKLIGFSLIKFISFLKFFINSIGNFLLFFTKHREFRYQFQWFYKQKQMDLNHLTDMTEVVLYATENLLIKSHFTNLLMSDKYFKRINKKKWQIKWINGKLFDTSTNTEILAFHFIDIKNQSDFIVESLKSEITTFSITCKGISNDK